MQMLQNAFAPWLFCWLAAQKALLMWNTAGGPPKFKVIEVWNKAFPKQ